jgi:hypothetical protein
MSKFSQWLSGSGLRGFLGGVVSNPSVQEAGKAVFAGIGNLILSSLNNPDKLKTMGQNLVQNPEAPLVAMLKGTPAEGELDNKVKEKGEAALDKTGGSAATGGQPR